jgi:hypothetical protein
LIARPRAPRPSTSGLRPAAIYHWAAMLRSLGMSTGQRWASLSSSPRWEDSTIDTSGQQHEGGGGSIPKGPSVRGRSFR